MPPQNQPPVYQSPEQPALEYTFPPQDRLQEPVGFIAPPQGQTQPQPQAQFEPQAQDQPRVSRTRAQYQRRDTRLTRAAPGWWPGGRRYRGYG